MLEPFNINLNTFDILLVSDNKRLGILLRSMGALENKLEKNKAYYIEHDGIPEKIILSHSIKRRRSKKHPEEYRYQMIGKKINSGRREFLIYDKIRLYTLIKKSPYYFMVDDDFSVKRKMSNSVIKSVFIIAPTYLEIKCKDFFEQELSALENEAELTRRVYKGTKAVNARDYEKYNKVGMRDEYRIELYFFMPFIQGCELHDFFTHHDFSKLEEWQLFKIAENIFYNLDKIHSTYRIVHRDIKFENILIDPQTLDLDIIDFGFAKDINNIDDINGAIAGTPLYFSPELGRSNTTTKSDCYAMGAVLAYLLLNLPTANKFLDTAPNENDDRRFNKRDLHVLDKDQTLNELSGVDNKDAKQIMKFIKQLSDLKPEKRPPAYEGFRFFEPLARKYQTPANNNAATTQDIPKIGALKI